MTFTVTGGGGGVDANRNGNSGRAATVSGQIVLNGEQTVTLKPGSAGQLDNNAGQGAVLGGKAASNSLTSSAPNGGTGRGTWAGGGGAASVLEVDGTVIAIAGGGGGTSQSRNASLNVDGETQWPYGGGNTRNGGADSILQGDGYAGTPLQAGDVGAGNRGEGAVLRVTEFSAENFSEEPNGPNLILNRVATGVNGGAGGAAAGGGQGGTPGDPYTFQGLYPNGAQAGGSGASGAGGNAPDMLGGASTPAAGGGGGGLYGGGAGGLTYTNTSVYLGTVNYTQGDYSSGAGSGGGGGSSWVSEDVLSFTADTEPNPMTNADGMYYGKHGRVDITFSC